MIGAKSTVTQPAERYYPPLGAVMLYGFLFMTFAAIWTASQVYFETQTSGKPVAFIYPVIWEFTGHWSSLLFVPVLYRIALRFPVRRRRLLLIVLLHTAISFVFSIANTTLFFQLRFWIYDFFNLGSYGYGHLRYRYIFEFHKTLVFYWAFYGFLRLFAYVKANRERELQTARLETQLNQARLDVLKSQINPHFLFNTLNTISSIMYEDLQAADRMISLLSQMLRKTLERSGSQVVSLGEEIALLELYFAIMQTRFQEKLVVRIDVPPDALSAAVPSFLLQPLVENAIKYNRPVGDAKAEVALTGRVENNRLLLNVEDNGPGLAEGLQPGTGLTNVRARLEHLYGSDARFALVSRPSGGVRASIDIPLRIGAGGEDSETKPDMEVISRA